MISNNDIYSRTLPYAKIQKAERKYKGKRKRRKKKEERKEKKLVTQERAKKTRERITRGEFPSPRPITQSH